MEIEGAPSGSTHGDGVPADPERQTLARVAWYYYRDNLTQAQIADRLHVSRPTVARLLDRARQTGVVSINIDTTGVGGLDLPQRLRDRYGLRDVVVVPQPSPAASGETTNSRIALAGAQYLRRHLSPGAVIGVGWGDTVVRTLTALPPSTLNGVTFATLTGGIDAYTSRLAGSGGAGLNNSVRFVPAPLIASSARLAKALRKEPVVTEVLDAARNADATLIGIGSASPTATILQNGVIDEVQLRQYIEQGAVGDIVGDWYDAAGRLLAVDLQALRVGLSIAELPEMRNVIAVAGGIDKADAISGALAGAYLDVLVTTEDVARDLLAR
jgi:lsr operon transcriptional repressor